MNLVRRQFIFDSNTNELVQTLIGGHILTGIRESKMTTWDICIYSLANSITTSPSRFRVALIDIITEYSILNPGATKVMGAENRAPYNGTYDASNNTISFDLKIFPDTLIIILAQFCVLAGVYSLDMVNGPSTPTILARMQSQNSMFSITNCNPSDSYQRVKPIEKVSIIKSKFDVINPGEVQPVNNAGGTTRVLHRGSIYDKDGNPYCTNSGKNCWWHRHPFEGPSMGIPIRVKCTIDGPIIYMDGHFCSYSCVLAYLNEEMSKIVSRRDPNFANSKTLLLQLYNNEYPGDKLYPARDWTLMKDVGNGNLSLREYTQHLQGFGDTRRPNYQFHPVTITHELVSHDK